MKTDSRLAWISGRNIAFWSGIVALIVFSYWWRLKVLNIFPFVYDEGIHLILGKLWAAGYTPYTEIFVSYPPSFMWSLGIPWAIFNQASALQIVMTTYALGGVLAVVYLGSAYNSRLAGLAAGTLLSFTPAYFIPSFSIMTEVPSISMATVAIALAEKFRRTGSWGYALLTGIGLAFGLSLKVLPYYAVPFIGLLIISRHITRGDFPKGLFIRDVAILTAGFLAIFFLPLLFFDISALYEQVMGMRLASREVDLNPFESNNTIIIDFLFGNPGLLTLASYGLVFVVARNLRRYWPLIIWFVSVWVSMYFLIPLRDKHLPIFLPVLALFAGFALNDIIGNLRQIIKQPIISSRSMAMLLAIVVVLGMLTWNVSQAIAENNGETLVVTENKERLKAIGFIDKIATPNDCVIADNPIFLFQTRRLPPPELSETSQTRIDTGYLTLQDVIDSVQKHRCHVVAVVTPRFGESIPGLSEWLANNYLGLYAQDETFVYFAPKEHSAPQEQTNNNYAPIQNGDFGDMVRLYGLLLKEQPWVRGEKAFISLLWQLESPIEGEYIEKITLRNPKTNEQVYQMTRLPFEGQFNPAAWHVNEQVRDTFWLDIPTDLSVGDYDLFLSLCDPSVQPCLTINNQQQTELYLGQITLIP